MNAGSIWKEPFVKKLKEEMAQEPREIHITEQVSGMTYAALTITSLDGGSLHPAKPISALKLRFQTLLSGARFVEGPYRLDNCHGQLHSHFQGSVAPVPIVTLNDACLMMCGSMWRRKDHDK